MSETIIGIDLGTTNSEVAVVQDGRVVVIEDAGRNILPSFVGIGESGEILVGETAKNQYRLYPERTVKSIKRKMGEEIKVNMGEESYRPQEISAIILKRLKAIAEAYLGQAVQKAVITVPAYFSDAQRQATREAGEIAGLEVVRMINEPTAAALSYEAEQKARRQVMVYDLGGGTFDVSVVSLEEDVVEVLSSHGNNHLGGDDFDEKIIEHILNHLKEKYGTELNTDKKVVARINRAAEAAKIKLSDEAYVTIEEEYLTEHEGAPIHLSLELARNHYEEMISEYIEETLEAVHTALNDAKLTASNIEKILLVGGSTRTPLVSRRLQEEFRLEPHREIDPDLCVAMGAAIQGAMIGGEKITTSSTLVDITPYTYGTSAVGELNGQFYPFTYVPIIRKNSPLPVTKTEAFYTMFDNQEKVDTHIYQGESPDALQNTLIGGFTVENLGKVPSGNPILLTFQLDLNGILHVTAKEKCSGLEKSITIDNAISRFEHQELEQAKERINAIFGETTSTIEEQTDEKLVSSSHNQQIVQARTMIEKAEKMLDKASPQDRDEIVNLIESLNNAINKNDINALESPINKLSEIIYYMGV